MNRFPSPASLAASARALLSAAWQGMRRSGGDMAGADCLPAPPGEQGARALRADPFARLQRGSGLTYFAMVEFDRFLATRATLGFEIANLILASAGEQIEANMHEVQLGRTGQCSLEFTFTAPSDDEASAALMRCLACLEQPITVAGVAFRLRPTAAFAATGPDAIISDPLFHSVLGALAREGEGRVRQVDPLPRLLAGVSDLSVLRALSGAIEAGELALHYQPKLDCRAGLVAGAEGLLRWDSPELGSVPTLQIIRLAEHTGAIRELTVWAATQVARDQATLAAAGYDLTLSINLSGLLIPDRAFMLELLETFRAAPGRLGIEITETAVIDDPEAAIENLRIFAEAGVPVAIDDFGAGLSSLNYLKRLPADELKIDRQFVTGLTGSHRDPLIVRASIDLAHALEMKVTAEGVEDAMSLSLLRVMGCDMLQGYHIAKPMPLGALITFMAAQQRHLTVPDMPRSAPVGVPRVRSS